MVKGSAVSNPFSSIGYTCIFIENEGIYILEYYRYSK